ncbi:hypothetical protein Plhal703r1_c06g0034711 [Plasmopara halstedii]
MIQETEEEENDYQAIENVEEQISGTQAHSRTAEISQNDGDSPDYHQFAASFRLVQHNYMALHCLLHQQSSCFISQYLSSHYVHVTERPEGSELSKAPYSGMALCSTWLHTKKLGGTNFYYLFENMSYSDMSYPRDDCNLKVGDAKARAPPQ